MWLVRPLPVGVACMTLPVGVAIYLYGLAVVKLLLLLPVLGYGFEVVRDVGGACQVLHVCVRPKQVHQVVKVPGGVCGMDE